jgi:glycyl-tRNA synthetase beta chain
MNTDVFNDTFLVEILTEEIPPKELNLLAEEFEKGIKQGLKASGLGFDPDKVKQFSTPRRLAVLIEDLPRETESAYVDVLGPSTKMAYDSSGNPTPAAIGFAVSQGVMVDELVEKETEKGLRLCAEIKEPGKTVFELLPSIVQQALNKLPIAKKMHWGDHKESFVRPVHNVLMLYGHDVIEAEFFDCKTNRETWGHRFHAPKAVSVTHPSEYEAALMKAYVIADFEKRKTRIHGQINQLLAPFQAEIISDESLVRQVVNMVEWPESLLIEFEKEYLKLPREVLIACMEGHQQFFPVADKETGQLKALCISVSNIQSMNAEVIKTGNARIMNGRFADAQFFYESDLQKSLDSYIPRLKTIVFEKELGSLFDKSERVRSLAVSIAKSIQANVQAVERAAELAKTDLLSQMVSEFPELQGIMGEYYAKHFNEPKLVAQALREQYLPRYSGDNLPLSKEGQTIAIAERIDTLVGIFGINRQPSGDKDPFGLRRAALGFLRISLEVEKPLPLDIFELLSESKALYAGLLTNANVVVEVFEFIKERLKLYWVERKFCTIDEFESVEVVQSHRFDDMISRIKAVQTFKALKESPILAESNKRVANLLKRCDEATLSTARVDETLLLEPIEKDLFRLIQEKEKRAEECMPLKKYSVLLLELSTLNEPINAFFDKVMIMDKNKELRANRIALLARLHGIFLKVADISKLGSVVKK